MPPGSHHFSHHLNHQREGFGLAEVRTLSQVTGEWRDRSEYRKSTLFDRFMRFDLEG